MMNTAVAIHTFCLVDYRIPVNFGNRTLRTISFTLAAINTSVLMKIYLESCSFAKHFIWIIQRCVPL